MNKTRLRIVSDRLEHPQARCWSEQWLAERAAEADARLAAETAARRRVYLFDAATAAMLIVTLVLLFFHKPLGIDAAIGALRAAPAPAAPAHPIAP